MARGLSRSKSCGVFPDQGSNPCLLHWQADFTPEPLGSLSLWFWFAFLWWLVMLNIFSYAYWPFVYYLFGHVYWSPLPLFKIRLFDVLLLSCRSYLYFLYINLYQLYDLWVFSTVHRLSSHCVGCVFWCTQIFKFDVVSFVYFSSYCLLSMSYPRYHCQVQCHEDFPLHFLLIAHVVLLRS